MGTHGIAVLVLATGMLSACGVHGLQGAAAVQPAETGGEPAAVDPLDAILTHLPGGADRCVGGRPGKLAPEQARLFGAVSAAHDFLWNPRLAVTAYADATRNRRGHAARVTVVHSRLAGEALRAQLVAVSGLQLRFEPARHRCDPDDCPTYVELAGPHTAVMARGQWLSMPGADGVEEHCALLAARHPNAVEVQARRGDARADGALVPLLRSHGFVKLFESGVYALRRDTMPAPEAAHAVVSAGLTRPMLSLPAAAPPEIFGRLRRSVAEQQADTELWLFWDDLELLVGDGERRAAAAEYAHALGRLRPEGDVDVRDLGGLIQQVQFRMGALEHGGSSERRQMAVSLRGLLERGLDAHPARRDLARLLAQVLLSELAAGPDAVALAARRSTDPEADQAFWAQVRRHGLALSGVEPLATQLQREGVVPAGRVASVAADIVAALAAGTTFDAAEDAALAELLMGRHASLLALPTPIDLPVSALLESLCLLGRLAGEAEGFWLRVDGPWTGASKLDVVRFSDGSGVRSFLRLEFARCELAADAGRTLAGLPPVPLTLRLMLDDPAIEAPRVLLLSGAMSAGRLRLRATDDSMADIDWQALDRGVVAPLVGLAAGELIVPTSEPSDGTRMLELARGAFHLECELEVGRVRCLVGDRSRRHLRAALQSMLAESMAPLAKRLWLGAPPR